jgi:hypothetical protein
LAAQVLNLFQSVTPNSAFRAIENTGVENVGSASHELWLGELPISDLNRESRILEADQRLPKREGGPIRAYLEFTESIQETGEWVFPGRNHCLNWHSSLPEK